MAGGGGGGEFEVDINLTALLDVLTNLLFFLMFGFASQKAAVELDSNVTLPVSSSDTSPQPAIRLTIAQDALRVEKELVAPIQNGKVQGPRVDGRIDSLYRRLMKIKNEPRPALKTSPDILFVICDRGASYGAIREVLMTAAEAGFPKYRMAVLAD